MEAGSFARRIALMVGLYLLLLNSVFGAELVPESTNTLGTISVTNSEGRVFTNATVVRVTPKDVILLFKEGGGGMFPLASLPEADQRRFGYSKERADEYEARIALEKKLAAEAVAASTQQKQKEAEVQRRRAETFAKRALLRGTVIQKVEAGLLVSVEQSGFGVYERDGMTFLKGYKQKGLEVLVGIYLVRDANQSSYVDDSIFEAVVYPDGEFSYNSVGGYRKTVKAVTVKLK